MITKNNAENASKFICEKCNFKCCNKSNYTNHLTRLKHQNSYNELHKKEQKMPKNINVYVVRNIILDKDYI